MKVNFSTFLMLVRRVRPGHFDGVRISGMADEARALEVLAQVQDKRRIAQSNPHWAAGGALSTSSGGVTSVMLRRVKREDLREAGWLPATFRSVQLRKLPLLIDAVPDQNESPEDAAKRVLAQEFGHESGEGGRVEGFVAALLVGYADGLEMVALLAEEYSEDELPAHVHLAGIAYWLGITGQKKEATKWVRGHLDLYFGGPRGWRDTKQWVRFFEESYAVAEQRREEYAARLSRGSLDLSSAMMAEGAMAAVAGVDWRSHLADAPAQS